LRIICNNRFKKNDPPFLYYGKIALIFSIVHSAELANFLYRSVNFPTIFTITLMLTQVSIPIFIEKVSEVDTDTYYRVISVFDDTFMASDKREDRAVERLTGALRRSLVGLVKAQNHGKLARMAYSPELSKQHLRLALRLKKKSFEGKFFFVVLHEFDRRIVYCPKLPEVCFELTRGQLLADRAEEVLTSYFRHQEREEGKAYPEEAASNHFCRVSYVDVETNVEQKIKKNNFSGMFFASLDGGSKMDGSSELERVGRCINRLYPRQIKRAIMRDEIVAELEDLFSRKEQLRPVVLIGPSQVGKTAVVHELVAKREEQRKKSSQQFWLLNPQRMVSGMSYVGQWEERFLAIVKHMKKKDHIIYMDDLLGVFQAGKSSGSDLNIGSLLKAELEKEPLRMIAEATPEVWRKLKEVDRGFTDLFQVIPIREPKDDETQRILIRVMQMIENEKGCTFASGVIPTVMQLQKRYVRTRAFPGKAAEVLAQLAAKSMEISEEDVMNHFQQKSGISWNMLDAGNGDELKRIKAWFATRIMGQEAGVQAMINAVSLSKSKLNDPSRPLASLLFLGPTGVGKTECAKALAEYVFESQDRMLRMDMNEFVGPDAADRLIGGGSRPHGLLTAAVRRQPYTVILFDEIEKAHPSVFDLLLQVLGEGRLTDASGQTADFCNALIILTSNLGSAANASHLGFADAADEREKERSEQVYTEAAEKFFRPEFFNRIDKIVPFHKLNRSHIAGMVQRLAQKALGRFGISERKLILEIEPSVYEILTDHGFDPEYGARTLRRAVEYHLVQPLADALMEAKPDALTTLHVTLDEERKPVIRVSKFEEAKREYVGFTEISIDHAETLLEASDAFLDRAEDVVEALRADGDDYQDMLPYYELKEHLSQLMNGQDQMQRQIENELNPRYTLIPPTRFGKRSTRVRIGKEWSGKVIEKVSGSAAHLWLSELVNDAEIQTTLAFMAENLINKMRYIELLLENSKELKIETVELEFKGPYMNYDYENQLEKDLETGRWNNSRIDGTRPCPCTYSYETLCAKSLFARESGTILEHYQERFTQLQITSDTESAHDVNRIYIGSRMLDLRTGAVFQHTEIPEQNHGTLWQLLLPLLPTPTELANILTELEGGTN